MRRIRDDILPHSPCDRRHNMVHTVIMVILGECCIYNIYYLMVIMGIMVIMAIMVIMVIMVIWS